MASSSAHDDVVSPLARFRTPQVTLSSVFPVELVTASTTRLRVASPDPVHVEEKHQRVASIDVVHVAPTVLRQQDTKMNRVRTPYRFMYKDEGCVWLLHSDKGGCVPIRDIIGLFGTSPRNLDARIRRISQRLHNGTTTYTGNLPCFTYRGLRTFLEQPQRDRPGHSEDLPLKMEWCRTVLLPSLRLSLLPSKVFSGGKSEKMAQKKRAAVLQ